MPRTTPGMKSSVYVIYPSIRAKLNSVELIWTQPPPPARQRNLGRPEIVAAAMAVADEGGAEAVTMKAVAARLGPYTPMALYRYVGSKDGLVDLMLDAAIAEVAL